MIHIYLFHCYNSTPVPRNTSYTLGLEASHSSHTLPLKKNSANFGIWNFVLPPTSSGRNDQRPTLGYYKGIAI